MFSTFATLCPGKAFLGTALAMPSSYADSVFALSRPPSWRTTLTMSGLEHTAIATPRTSAGIRGYPQADRHSPRNSCLYRPRPG
ncbi:hypothetical protein B0I35DRAFT_427911 [Stachybotrys elegans]|uniref:Uncharacterized protein n=1 Tax=Stachybotrys elegans TaxID=80388 RepID=A0A8K0SSK5_9HYPO|nr:hypothetical protein B0I35DRAFT_427911 [Stachybotrys elegans]